MSHPNPSHPNRILHFRILELLGSGGNGNVYRVQDLHTNQVLALKTLKRQNDITLSRFKREYFALKKMNHPGIVRVFDAYFDHETPCFTMEWVQGKSLSHLIEDMEANPLIFETRDREHFALRLAMQVCQTLDYIHSFDEIHRDLKPDNLFVTLSGQDLLSQFRVKMLDFGLLKRLNRPVDTHDTEGGMIVGTVHYLSPEQARGTELDPRSDLFSLGVIMYRIITLSLPHDAKDVVGYLFKTVFETHTPVSHHVKDVNPELEALIHRLLSKQTDDRPPSARALNIQLERLAGIRKTEPQDYGVEDLTGTDVDGFGSPLLPPPFLGRDDVLTAMQHDVENLPTAHPQVMLVEGAQGMGKTATIQTLKARVRLRNLTILHTRFSDQRLSAQDPIGMLMDSLIRTLKPHQIRELFRDVYPYLTGISRYLRTFFDTRAVGRVDYLSPARKMQVLAINFIKLVHRLAEKGPVLMVLDDLHHAPERFFGWLTLFWEQLGKQRLALIMSCSSEDDSPAFSQFIQRLRSHSDLKHFPLKPLAPEIILRILQGMIPVTRRLTFSQPLSALLQKRSAGNPFYAVELFTQLYQAGSLASHGHELRLDPGAALNLPMTLDQALIERMERLPPDARELLDVSAILGISFDFSWLRVTLDWTEDKLQENLGFLIHTGILIEDEGPVYQLHFRSPFLQESLYHRIEPRTRARIHRRAARAIENALESDGGHAVEQVAFHYAQSVHLVRAIKFSYLAGNFALENKDTDKAIGFYEKCLDLMDRARNRYTKNLVHLKLADVHLANGAVDRALSYYDRTLAASALSNMEKLRAYRGRIQCFRRSAQLDRALDDAQKLVQLSPSFSKKIQAEALLQRGNLQWLVHGIAREYLDDVLKAKDLHPDSRDWPLLEIDCRIHANDILGAVKRIKALIKVGFEPMPPLLMRLALIRYHAGQFDRAWRLISRIQQDSPSDLLLMNPNSMVEQALLIYRIRRAMAPEHHSDEYLNMARMYVDRFDLELTRWDVINTELEQQLWEHHTEAAWNLVQPLRNHPLSPCHFQRCLFVCLALRAAFEVNQPPPRDWLHQFRKYHFDRERSFILLTHWVLTLSTQPPNLRILADDAILELTLSHARLLNKLGLLFSSTRVWQVTKTQAEKMDRLDVLREAESQVQKLSPQSP